MGASVLTTWKEWCEIWGKVNGVQCNYEESDPAELEPTLEPAGLGPFGREMGDAFRVSHMISFLVEADLTKAQYIVEFGNSGGDPTAVWPWDLDVKIERTTLEKYFRSQDWSSVLGS